MIVMAKFHLGIEWIQLNKNLVFRVAFLCLMILKIDEVMIAPIQLTT